MKKTIVTLFALAGVAAASSSTADLGNGITGTWTEYNLADDTTTGTNSLTLPASWGGPTSWITLDKAVSLTKEQKLTFSYTYESTSNNGIYGISFLGAVGESAFMIGNSEYANRDLAAAVTTLGSTGFYQGKAQAIRFNPGNSSDRIQTVAADDTQVNLGTVTPGAVKAEIAYDETVGAFVMTLSTGAVSKKLELGDSVAFDTISFAADANATQSFTGLNMKIETVPEPATATLSLLALAGLAVRRRRK